MLPTKVRLDSEGAIRKVGLLWQLGSFSGWGVLGLHIARRMLARGDLDPVPFYPLSSVDRNAFDAAVLERLSTSAASTAKALKNRPDPASPVRGNFPMLHGLGNGLFGAPATASISGAPNLAIVFLEDTNLGPEALDRGRRFARIAAGATWTAKVLRAAGLDQVDVCPQGIDETIFYPGPPRAHAQARFIVYSGGKLEFRKGQDIAVAAFRRFHERHPDALLITGWVSPWPTLARTMARSSVLDSAPQLDAAGQVDVAGWLRNNGLPEGSFQIVPAVPNTAMGKLLRQADVALFPNRCEGGTNLVAMEALACGVPTILSANTGHLDLIADVACYPLRVQAPVEADPDGMGTQGWGESSVDEIVEALERVYADRTAARALGERAAAQMRAEWSWDVRIDRMLESLGLRSREGSGADAVPIPGQ
ncbi:glycosyltransferase family 4 protein [Azospirillum sp. SYSU D00513]|uniref:glycosyltransferase family 4 protein n=1 Tax=Azospirillum sp. SYSU D00513 TaxID=2812561 RepID=UPI001A970D86|nr:glycosyltransferase family 4 protein [Azospirillum sp. SYSU D00513]